MKILMLGAGGVGGYFGGRLVESGADVTFLVRPKRAEQLATNGLVIKSPGGTVTLKAATVLAADVKPVYDFVLFTCKAYDLADAMVSITPAMGPQTALIPFLNGVKHMDTLDAAFGHERVLGGVAQIAATLSPAGEVIQLNDLHAVIFGERDAATSKRCEALAAVMAKAKFTSKLSPNIQLELWEKFLFLTTLAAMTCLMRAPVGSIVRSDDGKALMLEMLEECRSVAAASGYNPRPEFMQRITTMLTDPTLPFSASMMRDIEKGGPIESEHIVGDMSVRARKLGLPAPLLRVAASHLQTYEIVRKEKQAAAKPA
jgi:2-dehydropantoate 2-reductase